MTLKEQIVRIISDNMADRTKKVAYTGKFDFIDPKHIWADAVIEAVKEAAAEAGAAAAIDAMGRACDQVPGVPEAVASAIRALK